MIHRSLKYKAFISYSHEDERWAIWLHRALESYRASKAIGAEKPLTPVFRDRDELAASRNLSASIVEGLADSENLVVVCSRSAASSRWMNAEISEFIRLGRDNRIFCLFVDSSPPDECIPQALRSDRGTEPLGADVHVDGRRGAKLKLIAALLGVDYDTLRQRSKERRRAQIIRYSAVSAVAIGLVSALTYRIATEPPCTSSTETFAGVWNTDRAASIRQEFSAAGVPFGEHAVDTVLSILSGYANQWVEIHKEACEATMVREVQSAQLMDLRMACLTERRLRFDALTQRFQQGDLKTISNAVYAANSLGQLSRCSDRPALLAAYPAPEGQLADLVAGTRARIAELRALVDSEVALPALSLAESVWQEIEGLEYPPVHAEVLVLLGRAQVLRGNNADAQSTFVQAASRAVISNDNELAAEAWLNIPPLIREKVKGADEARDMLDLADAYVRQLPDDHPLRASYHANLGEVLIIQGEIDQGIERLELAVAAARSNADIDLPTYLNRLARAHGNHLELETALPLVEESIELSAQYFSESHPEYARALQAKAALFIDSGDAELAIAIIEESMEIEKKAFPENHTKIAATYAQLGSAYFRSVQPEPAEEALLMSLATYANVGDPSPIALGDAHNNIGNLYSYLERFDESEHHLQEAARLWESVDFYLYSIVLNNLGSMVMAKEEYDKARDYCEQALAADELQFPPDSPNIAYPLSCLGEALVNLEEYDLAIEHLRRAYSIRRASHQSPLPMAHTRITLAMALWEVDGDIEEIKGHYEFALNTVIEHDTGDEAELRSWAEGKGL